LNEEAAFTGMKNLTLAIPSKWFGNLVKMSCSKEYLVELLYDRIFNPISSNFHNKY
jgi:hypothetical protein